MSDSINPDHYKRLPVEAIEIIESAIQGAPTPQKAFLHGQVLKYVLRCWAKNGVEDLQKAKWYLHRLLESAKPSGLQSLTDPLFEEPSSEPPKPAFAVGDRVRVCKPGSFLSGIAGVIQSVDGDDRIEVKNKTGWGFFRASELQPVEASK